MQGAMRRIFYSQMNSRIWGSRVVIIELTLLLAFSATLLRTLLLTTLSLTQENKLPPMAPKSSAKLPSPSSSSVEISSCWSWFVCAPELACGCLRTGCSPLPPASGTALSLAINCSEGAIAGLATKLGNADGGAMLDNKFPVEVDVPKGVKREAEDERLLIESSRI